MIGLRVVGRRAILRAMKYLLILSTLFFMSLAHAGDYKPEGTRVSLSAEAYEEVANDEVVVSYRIEAKGDSAKLLRKKVDGIAAKVSERLKKEKVKHETTNRSLNPVWDSGVFTTKSWQLVQAGQIKTQDIDAVPGWMADIEAAGVKLNGLQFQVSDKLRKQIEDRLRTEAIRNFRAKAGNIAEGLTAKSFRIIDMQTNASGMPGPMRGVAMMEDGFSSVSKSRVAPSLAGGESRIQVNVSGVVEVPFKDFPVK